MENTSSSTKPTVDSGGYAIYEKDNKVCFVNYSIRWVYILNFVSGLLLTILLINGVAQLFINSIAGIIILLVALPFLLILILGVRLINKRKSKSLDELNKTAIIDFNNKQLLNKHGQPLAPLETVTFYKAWQLGDSSRSVEARWPNGSITLARGLSLAGGSSEFVYYLVKKGLMKE